MSSLPSAAASCKGARPELFLEGSILQLHEPNNRAGTHSALTGTNTLEFRKFKLCVFLFFRLTALLNGLLISSKCLFLDGSILQILTPVLWHDREKIHPGLTGSNVQEFELIRYDALVRFLEALKRSFRIESKKYIGLQYEKKKK